MLWFDIPKGVPDEYAKEAFGSVRELKPSADYKSMDDNYLNNILPPGLGNGWHNE